MVKRKNLAPKSLILKHKPNPKMLKKLAVAILITLVAGLLYAQIASHTQAAKNQRKLEQTSIQLNVKKVQLQKEIKAHHLTNTEQEKQIKELNEQLKAAQEAKAERQRSATAYAATKPLEPSYVAPTSSYSGSGDSYLDYIIAHESSGNQYAVNSIGACGLFQALPCSKLGCDLSDTACQLAWGRTYAINRYGSTAAAYQFWIANHYW